MAAHSFLASSLVTVLLLTTTAPELARAGEFMRFDESDATPQRGTASLSNIASQGLPTPSDNADPGRVRAATLFAQQRPIQGTIGYHYVRSLYNETKRPRVAAASALPPCPYGGCGGCPATADAESCTPINYNRQKPIMKSLNLVPVFYGTAWTDAQKQIIYNFLYGLGGSSWARTSATYGDLFSVIPNVQVAATGSPPNAYFNGQPYWYNSYFLGTKLTDADIQTLADGAVNAFVGGGDPEAIYLVLTDTNVTQVSSPTSAFCANYCGWHHSYTKNGKQIKYAFVGNALTQCKDGCISFLLSNGSPNGDIGVDGMVSVLAHEITEAATNPTLDIWYDANGNENADKCAWQFGDTSSNYNTCMFSGCFLIQTNWVRGGGCALTA